MIHLTTLPGLSKKEDVALVSGRGVGLDVGRSAAEELGSGIFIFTTKGKGSKITMRLPISTVVAQALMVKASGSIFAVPMSSVIEIIRIDNTDIKPIEHQETVINRDKVLPVFRFEKLFPQAVHSTTDSTAPIDAHARDSSNGKINIVVVEYDNRQFGIAVDRLITQQDIVIKQLSRELKGVRGFSGATILGDGSVALVLDVATVLQEK